MLRIPLVAKGGKGDRPGEEVRERRRKKHTDEENCENWG